MMAKAKGDMGPFAGMDAALVRAVSSYGTPPYREMVRVTVRDVGHYSFNDLPTTIPEWIEWLNRAHEDTPEEYRDRIKCELQWDAGYYDSGDSASLVIWYDRPETDAEMTERVNRGIAHVRSSETSERAMYEALKRKFESRQE